MPIRTPIVCLIAAVTVLLAGCATGTDPARTAAGENLEAGFQERRAILTDQVADNYQPTDYTDRGKYSFPVVIARGLKVGPDDERLAGYIAEYASGNYTFFHFPFVGMARILCLFPDAPVIAGNREAFLERILFHDPEYHYNALTGEGTENHVAMSRTSGYLFAQEAMRYPDLRERAAAWQSVLKDWILDWSRRAYHYGTGEWDSNPYTAYNVIGWLNLYDFAEDPEIRDAARAVVDYHAANMALKLTQGILGGPESRGGTRHGGLPRSATEYLGWLWFGPTELREAEGFFKPSEYIQAMHAASSRYRPPDELMPLARKEIPTPALYRNNKPNYLMTEAAESRETFLIGDTFTLGSVQTPYGGWINAAYGIINWKLVIENPGGLPAVVLGNGGMKSTKHARGRNPFDQFLQYRSTLVQMTRVPANAEAIEDAVEAVFKEWREDARSDFMERWGRKHQFHGSHISDSGKGSLDTAGLSIVHFPEDLEARRHGTWQVLRHADTWVALHPLSGKQAETHPGRLIDRAERDRVSGFVVEVVNASGDETSNAFLERLSSHPGPEPERTTGFRYRTLDGDVMEFEYTVSGSWTEMIFDWGSGVREKRVGFNTRDWTQPDWPSGEGHGRIPSLRVNGQPVPRPGPGTVISGPLLDLENGVLTIEDTHGHRYRVDYSGFLPRFENNGMRNSKN